MEKCIVISEAMSTGLMYVDEICDRGYKPIIINCKKGRLEGNTDYMEDMKAYHEVFADRVVEIDEPDDFDELMEMLKPYDIEHVVVGSEYGVRTGELVAHALGIPGNDPETTWRRCTKNGMHQSLKEAGIRYIRTGFVKTKEDIEEFWKSNDLDSAVIKFDESAGTMGLKICECLDDALPYFDEVKENWKDSIVETQDVLIQEYIGGTEYIVNSISYNGNHKVTDIWRYKKVLNSTGNLVYDSAVLETVSTPGMYNLVQYAYKVLDAVGVKCGPCHMELKIDDKGPVLIETNIRPMGAGMTKDFLDEILGHHITDMVLDIFINPARFEEYRKRLYRPLKPAILKFLIMPHDIVGSIAPAIEMIKHLRSYRSFSVHYSVKRKMYKRTIDLFTSPLTIFMCNSDPLALTMDNSFIDLAESKYISLLFSNTEAMDATLVRTSIDRLTSSIPDNKRYLIVENDRASVYMNGSVKKETYDNWDIYDGVILSFSDASTVRNRINDLVKRISQVRMGGRIIIAPETYMNMPCSVESVEVIMTLMRVIPELPDAKSNGVIVGTRS